MLDDVRSLLFVPASDERRVRRALDSGADAVVADLEDGVALQAKVAARERLVASGFGTSAKPVRRLARINATETEWLAGDLELVRHLDLDGIVVPKASLRAVESVAGTGLPAVALVETAEGLATARCIAGAPNVVALFLGALDLGHELRLQARPDGLELLFPRAELVLASALHGLRPPFDAVFPNVRDSDALEQDSERALSLGFGGKACIHPDQVAVVNRVFTVSESELDQARQVVAAYEAAVAAGRGATALEGQLVDLPVALRAQRLLAQEGKDTA